jgi:hypothetical protein
VAVVQFGARSGKAAEIAVFAATAVASSGVRWVELTPQTMPRLEEVKQRILGV